MYIPLIHCHIRGILGLFWQSIPTFPLHIEGDITLAFIVMEDRASIGGTCTGVCMIKPADYFKDLNLVEDPYDTTGEDSNLPIA